jgi:hypothetical protein
VGERERRIGRNEALSRQTNERIEEIGEAFALVTQEMGLVCECGDINCTEQIRMSISEYEQLRADARQFVITPGHEFAEVEEVVERTDRFWIVRKHNGEAAAIAEALDPRG